MICPRNRQKIRTTLISRCQPSRNRARNPACWLISRILAFLRERPAFLALFRNNKKSLKIAIIFDVRRHFVRKSSAKTAMTALPIYN